MTLVLFVKLADDISAVCFADCCEGENAPMTGLYQLSLKLIRNLVLAPRGLEHLSAQHRHTTIIINALIKVGVVD